MITTDEKQQSRQSNMHGDPSTALLENWSFDDDYIHAANFLVFWQTGTKRYVSNPEIRN